MLPKGITIDYKVKTELSYIPPEAMLVHAVEVRSAELGG
jgi:hypothetical protein